MYDYALLFLMMYTKESMYTELFTLLFQIIYKRVIQIEFAYLIEKQSIFGEKQIATQITYKKQQQQGKNKLKWKTHVESPWVLVFDFGISGGCYIIWQNFQGC